MSETPSKNIKGKSQPKEQIQSDLERARDEILRLNAENALLEGKNIGVDKFIRAIIKSIEGDDKCSAIVSALQMALDFNSGDR